MGTAEAAVALAAAGMAMATEAAARVGGEGGSGGAGTARVGEKEGTAVPQEGPAGKGAMGLAVATGLAVADSAGGAMEGGRDSRKVLESRWAPPGP